MGTNDERHLQLSLSEYRRAVLATLGAIAPGITLREAEKLMQPIDVYHKQGEPPYRAACAVAKWHKGNAGR